MGTITALRLNSRKKQVIVFINGLFSFAIGEELAIIRHLKVGLNLSADQVDELKESGVTHRCMEAAVHFLSYRPRSESEVRNRLKRRGFDDETIQEVVSRLKNMHLIDDVTFSRYWLDNRLSFKPRSARLIKLELRKKGVAEETINEVTKDVDDENSVYEAGLKRARRLAGSDYDEFRRRLYDYLRRRGYNYDKVKCAVERLWKESEQDI